MGAPDSQLKNIFYRSLTRRIILIIVVVSVIPLILISGIIRQFFLVSYQEKVQEHLKVLIKKHSQNIDSFLNEKLANIKVLADSSTFDQLADRTFLTNRLQVFQMAYGRTFVDLGLVNGHGRQIAYSGPFELKEADYSLAPWFQEASQGETYISDVFAGLRGSPHFIVAVRRETAGQKWVLRATIDFDAFNSLVENLRFGSTGFAYILNSRGEFQTKSQVKTTSDSQWIRELLSTIPTANNEPVIREKIAPTGENLVYTMSSLKNGHWILTFQQDALETYAALYAARRVNLAISILGIAAVCVVAILLSRRVVNHIMLADREKQEMNERIIEAGKMAALGELAAGIAHEINNPVAVMVEEAGWMQDLIDEEDLKQSANLEEFKQSLKQIRVQGSRCKQITHKLLSFARKTDSRPKRIALNETIEEVLSLCQQRARYSTVKIITHLDPNLPLVNASPSEMQQVFLNLIINSLDAIDNRGGQVEITTRAQDQHVIVDVADNGPGIPEAYLARIFDPFFTTKPPGQGTGLGLSICYGIITQMGGEITVDSVVGTGTTFHIKLPVSELPREDYDER